MGGSRTGSSEDDDASRAPAEVTAAHFAALFDRALDGVVILDDEGRYLDANPAACAMNGVTREQVLGQRIGRGSGALGGDEQFAHAWRAFLARGEMSGELRMRRGDGSVVELEFRATAGFVPHRHLAILRDVTDRNRAQRRLAAQHAVTRILAEAETLAAAAPRIIEALCGCLEWSVGGLWLVDPSAGTIGCVEMWRAGERAMPEFERMTRSVRFVPGQGLPGRVWASASPAWVPDVVQDGNFPRAEVARRENLHGAFALPVVLAGETLGVLEFFSHEIRPPDDDVLAMLATIGSQIGQFIERKRAEASLREADRRKDEFLAMLAHELRNPLAPIRNAVEVITMTGGGNADVDRACRIVRHQIDHMTRLIDDLLDVSRITRGAIALRRMPTELQAIIARAVESSAPLLTSHEHRLEVSVPPVPVVLDADAARLEQVLANLLNNAAKYTPRGGNIRLTADVHDGHARVRVRDDGMGIAAEVLPTIFDLFVQADRSLDRAQGGLGIGLTLVRTLVELHGGAVHAASDGPGTGSEFTVMLPLASRA